jgi:hypothetical protein
MVVRACLLLAPLWLGKIGEKGQQLDLWLLRNEDGGDGVIKAKRMQALWCVSEI